MSPIPNLRRVFRLSMGKQGVGKDAEEEIRYHIEKRIADLRGDGMTPDEAERTAHVEFGDLGQVRRELEKLGRRRARRRQREEILSSTLTDTRIAVRGLQKRPAFGLVAILTLAVAIGGNTTIFSAVDALLLRPLPFPEPEELVQVSLMDPPREGRAAVEMTWSFLKFQGFAEAQEVLKSTVIYFAKEYNLTQALDPEELRVEGVSAGYFRFLGIPMRVGRAFLPEEDATPGRDLVVVLSHELWERRYGGDPGVLGATIHLNHRPHTVVGVAAPGFEGLSAGVDMWVPTMALEEQLLAGVSIHAFQAVGRLREGTTLKQARGEAPRLAEVVTRIDPRGPPVEIRIRPLDEVRIGPRLRQAVVILFLAVAFVHLIACINLANLLLARATGRSREVAIRAAVGAGRGRLMRQLLTETLVLALLGSGAGMVLAVWGTAALRRMGLRTQDFLAQTEVGLTNLGFRGIGLDMRTIAFGLCLTLLTALLFGVGPALRTSRPDLNAALKAGTGLDRKRVRRGRLKPSLPGTLVAAQVALAVVLLVGSGLLVRSLGHLLTADVGFREEQVLSARVELPRDQYGDYFSYGSERSARFLKELAERARHIPGVEVAALARCAPLSGSCPGNGVILPDRPPGEGRAQPMIRVNMVEGDYFDALGIRLERGRLIRATDNGEAPPVVVVNRTAADLYWPGEDPIGRPIQAGGWFGPNTVVGVVADVHYRSIELPPEPMLYVPLAQLSAMGGIVVMRGRGDPLALVEGLKTHLRELDPNLPLAEVKTMSEWVAEATVTPRFSAALLGLFAAVALLLSTLGVYGVLSVVVARQTQEVGVRMALGARTKDVLEVVVGRAAGMVLPGVVVGLLLAFVFTRLLEALLFGIHPRDPATFLGGALALTLAGAAATLMPALRATRVDPVEALKAE